MDETTLYFLLMCASLLILQFGSIAISMGTSTELIILHKKIFVALCASFVELREIIIPQSSTKNHKFSQRGENKKRTSSLEGTLETPNLKHKTCNPKHA